eukprot:scaffold73336_cov59-Phaeocystis_antarctica.AAC.1
MKHLPKPAPLSIYYICASPPLGLRELRRGCRSLGAVVGGFAWQQAEQSAARVEDLTFLCACEALAGSPSASSQVHHIHTRLAEATGREAGRDNASRLTEVAVACFGLGAAQGVAARRQVLIEARSSSPHVQQGLRRASSEGAALVAREEADRRGAVVLPRGLPRRAQAPLVADEPQPAEKSDEAEWLRRRVAEENRAEPHVLHHHVTIFTRPAAPAHQVASVGAELKQPRHVGAQRSGVSREPRGGWPREHDQIARGELERADTLGTARVAAAARARARGVPAVGA